MLNKNIQIYCKMEDNLKVQKFVEGFTSDVVMIDATDKFVRLTINCSIFKIGKLKHNLELLNKIGIKTEIKGA